MTGRQVVRGVFAGAGLHHGDCRCLVGQVSGDGAGVGVPGSVPVRDDDDLRACQCVAVLGSPLGALPGGGCAFDVCGGDGSAPGERVGVLLAFDDVNGPPPGDGGPDRW
ncbi:hypothetical protein BH18ACT8_BH18ACT8_16300 [soil metagenome]